MFQREHHCRIALVLQSLRADLLAGHQCWFAGGTAMALRFGEYRESLDIDFLISDRDGYRAIRSLLATGASLAPLMRPGMQIEQTRPVRADQYGLRTQVRIGDHSIKFEIVLEGRIELARPGRADSVCGVATLSRLDLAAEKLLANADRWADGSVFSRDLIDLAMHPGPAPTLRAALAKAEAAYGSDVRRALGAAIAALRERSERLDTCMQALAIRTVSKAQLLQRIRRLSRLAA